MAQIEDVVAGVTTPQHTEVLWNLADRETKIRLLSSAPLTDERVQWVVDNGDAEQCVAVVSRRAPVVTAGTVERMLAKSFRKTILNAAAAKQISNATLISCAIDNQATVACRTYARTLPAGKHSLHAAVSWRLLAELLNSTKQADRDAAYTLQDRLSSEGPYILCDLGQVPSSVPWPVRIQIAGPHLFYTPTGIAWAEQAVAEGHGRDVLRELKDCASPYRMRGRNQNSRTLPENLRQWVTDTFPPHLVDGDVESALNLLDPLPEPPEQDQDKNTDLSYDHMMEELTSRPAHSVLYLFRNFTRRVPVWNPVPDVLSGRLPWDLLGEAVRSYPPAAADVVEFLMNTDLQDKDYLWWAEVSSLPKSILANPCLISKFSSVEDSSAVTAALYNVNKDNVWALVPAHVSARMPEVAWEYILDRSLHWSDSTLTWQFILEHVDTWTGTLKELADTVDVMFS